MMDEYIELRNKSTAKGRFSFDGNFWFEMHVYPNAFHRWMHRVFFGMIWEKL